MKFSEARKAAREVEWAKAEDLLRSNGTRPQGVEV
jgi:hypothetical protein